MITLHHIDKPAPTNLSGDLKRRVILEKYVGEIEAMYSRQTPSPEAQEVGAG